MTRPRAGHDAADADPRRHVERRRDRFGQRIEEVLGDLGYETGEPARCNAFLERARGR